MAAAEWGGGKSLFKRSGEVSEGSRGGKEVYKKLGAQKCMRYCRGQGG